jgi:hypothetical protein
MKLYKLLCLSLLLCFVFPILSYADQLEDAKATIQNEDFEKACELLGPLAEENNAEAQFLLGSLYINGQGVEKDDTKGLSWIMKAARQGYDQARSRAFSIYLELANRGDVSAMYNLGYMCLHGWGGEQDPDVGIGWLESAAKNGHDRSAKVLSGIYAEGKFGITPDEDKASFWSNLPAEFAAGIDGTWTEEAPDQGGPTTEPTFDSDAQEYILEDTIVKGKRFLRSLRMQMIRAEDLKFEIFNSLNSTDDFDITCERVEQTGSIVTMRVCDVGFMKKARARDAQLFLDDMGDARAGYPGDRGSSSYPPGFQPLFPRSNDHLAGEFALKYEALKKEMVELGSKHPSLAKVMLDEYELKQRYILEQRKKFIDSIMIGHPEPEEYFGDELKWLNIAFLAHYSGMMEEEIWSYWDRRLRSVIHQEPYQSIWLSSNTETYAVQFVAYVNRILSGG